MDTPTFFSLLEEKLLYLGLDEPRARSEISAFRAKMKGNPRFDLFIARAGEKEVAATAERLYAGMIVRSNTALRNEPVAEPATVTNAYTDDFIIPAADDRATSDTLERPAAAPAEEPEDDFLLNQKPDYVSLFCQRLKQCFAQNPASRLLLVLLVPLVFIGVAVTVIGFCALIVFLCALLLFFLLLTCGVAVGGTGAALSGIIYGVIKLFTGYAPIGWYEIGIAVAIIGMTIFAGVVFYNCAIQLLPFTVRLTGRLMKHFFRHLADDLKTAKGVFAS